VPDKILGATLISLKNYWNTTAGDTRAAIRAVSLFIQGIGLHALDQNKEDFDSLRTELHSIENRLNDKTTEPEVLVIVGEVIKTLDSYNRRTSGKLRCQFAELHGIIAALGGAMAKTVSASDVSLARLREIQSELSTTRDVEDLRRLKTHLAHCLESITTEVEAHKKQAIGGLAAINDGVRHFATQVSVETQVSRAQTKPAVDPVTGLPTRSEAEIALAGNPGMNTPTTVVILAVKRLKQVNLRFGYGAGDGLLERLATYMGTARPDDELYRWSGPALLSVIRRDVPFEQVREDVRRLVARMPDYEIQIGSRVALIVLAVGWAAFPVTGSTSKLVAQLDDFVASQISEDGYVAK